MLDYSFLILSLLFMAPGLVILLLRRDLRPMLWTMAVLSLPFALTEFLFYPDYWDPKVLFDLVERIGFGIEDVLFVVGLGWLTAGIYPAVTGRTLVGGAPLVSLDDDVSVDGDVFARRSERTDDAAGSSSVSASHTRRALGRLAAMFGVVALAVAASAVAGIPTIYAAPVIMLAASLWIMFRRGDLLVPGLLGALLTTLVYALLSWILAALIPGVFELDWNTEAFTNIFILGIPLEELIYGGAAGLIGAVFYPYLTEARFARRRSVGPGAG
jgi:hypothetical protein